MKSNSNIRPASLLDLGEGNWHYNWNITEGVREDEQGNETPDYNYDTVLISGEPTVAKIVAAVVHESYTEDEIALMNAQHQAAAMGLDDEPDGYGDYLSLVVSTRTEATQAMEAFMQNQGAVEETSEETSETEEE